MKKILILLLVASILLLTSGCTDSTPAPETPPPTPVVTKIKTPSPTYNPTTAIPTMATPVPASDNIITIKKLSLTPQDLTIKTGGQVFWVNADSSDDPAMYNPTHRISILNVKDGQLIAPGTSWSWTFPKAGVYYYSDLIHTNLKGTITVV